MLDDLIYDQLEKSNSSGSEIMVTVSDQGRGGYFAFTSEEVRGFLPNSQLLEGADILGKKIPVKIIELNKAARRVIFSQKALHYVTDLAAMQKYVHEGEKVKGTISSTSPYGIYIDIEPRPEADQPLAEISPLPP